MKTITQTLLLTSKIHLPYVLSSVCVVQIEFRIDSIYSFNLTKVVKCK